MFNMCTQTTTKDVIATGPSESMEVRFPPHTRKQLWNGLVDTITVHLANSMELSLSWEAASWTTTQEFINMLLSSKVHFRLHKNHPLVFILSQINPIHTIISYLSEIHFTIAHPPSLGLPSGLLSSAFPTNVLHTFLFSPFVLHALPISFSLTSSSQFLLTGCSARVVPGLFFSFLIYSQSVGLLDK
jgi:hypothetical protein